MADFCLQCNLDMHFGPYSDFDGAISEEGYNRGMTAVVLCEGCGVIRVDHKGRCIDLNCLYHGHTAPEAVEVLRNAEAWLARRSGPLGALYRLRDRLLGTPWDQGWVHHLKWRWYAWEYRNKPRPSATVTIDEIRSDYLHKFFYGTDSPNCRCVVVEIKNEQADTATGVEAPSEDDHVAPQSGVVRDEDIGPL